ncbi:adenine phosphoribosyltransferase-like [Daphnia pulex]|uniref:adenine phosphoribosyltransferase-like n=1 Tax=Daphnia pulex TaxID=6669 RepID=UPI001EDDA312|nr:adenine phosphoribosyltransferase-like [Daphnia pulex]
MDSTLYDSTLSDLKDKIKSYPDFPKEGIIFRDIFSILRDPACLKSVIDLMVAKIEKLKWNDVDVIVGLESRGFILAPLLAVKLNAGFVPIRKKGRLPGVCKEIAYTLEYRSDVLEIQEDSISQGQRVLVIDDLIATGGSLGATCKLLKGLDAKVVGCLVLLELDQLEGSKNVDAPVESLITF